MAVVNKKEKISVVIEKRGLKKAFIAKEMQIDPATLSRKLSDPSTFSASQIDVLIEILNVNIDSLDFEVKNF